jgi:ribosomal protein L30E
MNKNLNQCISFLNSSKAKLIIMASANKLNQKKENNHVKAIQRNIQPATAVGKPGVQPDTIRCSD